MEALVRWSHPTHGLISPAAFIPIAEESGLIVHIGEWVLRTACAQNVAWQHADFTALPVAVNLSAHQLKQNDFIEMLNRVLNDTELDAHSLELELTESSIMQDVEGTISTLRQIKDLGVQLSIDDFGTGYSSLAYLKRFPVDAIKIDQSFVCDIAHDATPQSHEAVIIKAIVSLAHGLHLRVIAEGVEAQV